MMQLFIPSSSNADTAKIEEASDALTEATKNFYAGLGDEIAFSGNFGGSLMPDILYIYDVKDEAQVKATMEKDFTGYLGATMGLMQALGTTEEFASMYSDVSAGPPEIYSGVEIKSYILPNINAIFAELPPGMEVASPEQWNVYYAINGGKMLYAMAGNAQLIKSALDRMAGMEAGFDEGAGYAKLTGALTLQKQHVLCAFTYHCGQEFGTDFCTSRSKHWHDPNVFGEHSRNLQHRYR